MALHPRARYSLSERAHWFEPIPGEQFAVRLDGQGNGNTVSMTELILAPELGSPMHIHHDADEVHYLLSGTIDFVCEGARFRFGPGGLVVVPRGARHALRNVGDGPAHILGLLHPGGFEQFLMAMNGRPVADIAALAARHHLEIVGPGIAADAHANPPRPIGP